MGKRIEFGLAAPESASDGGCGGPNDARGGGARRGGRRGRRSNRGAHSSGCGGGGSAGCWNDGRGDGRDGRVSRTGGTWGGSGCRAGNGGGTGCRLGFGERHRAPGSGRGFVVAPVACRQHSHEPERDHERNQIPTARSTTHSRHGRFSRHGRDGPWPDRLHGWRHVRRWRGACRSACDHDRALPRASLGLP